MLLGCCHCGESVSDSQSDSQSDSASTANSDSASTANYKYGACGCVAVPVAWEVIWPTMDANAACPTLPGTYELTRTTSETAGGCTWKCAELESRMKPVGGVWTCDNGTRSAFRIQVNPGLFSPIRIELEIRFVVWGPSGFGSAYVNKFVRYGTADGVGCLQNGAMTYGGSNIDWPNVTDATFPYTFITLPAPADVTIRPKL